MADILLMCFRDDSTAALQDEKINSFMSDIFLPPTSAVEGKKSVPSVCLCVCPCVC